MSIFEANYSVDIPAITRLFTEYARRLGVDLGFQNFDEEIRSLPGKYAPPSGRILLASAGDDLAGAVALRMINAGTGEIKRLFVKPEFRGLGLGRKLAEAIIAESDKIGYEALFLDTLASMKEAIGLYERLGFTRTPAYYENPLPSVVYFCRRKQIA